MANVDPATVGQLGPPANFTMFGGEELDKLRIQVHDLTTQTLNQERVVAQMKEQITTHENERDKWAAEKRELLTDLRDIQQTASDFRARVDRIPLLEVRTSEAESEVKALREEVNKDELAIMVLRKDLDETQLKLSNALAERNALMDEIGPFRALIEALRKKDTAEGLISKNLQLIRASG